MMMFVSKIYTFHPLLPIIYSAFFSLLDIRSSFACLRISSHLIGRLSPLGGMVPNKDSNASFFFTFNVTS